MDNAVVLGYGMVGKATAHAFAIEKYFDIKESNISLKEASKLRYHFICLPTPTIKGQCWTEDIEGIIKQIVDLRGGQNVFIIRSTITPGTCKRIMGNLGISYVVHVPEFLSEETWRQDIENPDLIVIGGEDRVFIDDVVAVYRARYRNLTNYVITNTVTAETIKYAINCFYSLKVIYANELYDFCQRAGANYEMLKETMYKRKWIGNNHLQVWYRNKRGLGGHCLPKDLEAFSELSNIQLLKLAKKINEAGFN